MFVKTLMFLSGFLDRFGLLDVVRFSLLTYDLSPPDSAA